jgi:KAP family P-loop domain
MLLLQRTSSSQGSDALVITREQYLAAVEAQSESIKEKYITEIDSHLAVYVNYSRVRAILNFARAFFSLLHMIAFLIVYVTLIPLILLYLHESVFYSNNATHVFNVSLNVVLASKHDLLIILGAAIATLLLTSLLSKLLSFQIYRAYRTLQPSAHMLDQRLTNEFRTIIVDLMRTTRRLRYEPMLRSYRAPTLVEVESVRVFPSETFDEVVNFLELHVTSAVGIAGTRGAGKSTLLRWLFNTLTPEWITIYLATPAAYNALDFARMIFGTTVNTILANYPSQTIPIRFRIWNTFVRPRPPRSQEEIVRISNEMLNLIGRSRTDQLTITGGFSAKGASMTRQKRTTLTEREPTHPELIAAFTRYLETYRGFGGRKIVIAIDELDKLSTAEEAIGAVNSLKDLFHLPNTHFVVSVSEDALVRFVMRGIPFRDVFDSAFDNIVQVQPPSPEDAWKLLANRTGGFPISAALFCYAWSGGLPRDLIRAARACVAIRRRLGKPLTVAELAPRVVRSDLKDALSATLTTVLEEDSTQGVESMLALRRKIEDESIPLADVLQSADLRGEFEVSGSDQDRMLLLQRLALYADLGRSIVDYFTSSFDERVAGNFDEVVGVVRKFARAKLALSTYPSEAEWLLSEAVKAMRNDRWRSRRRRAASALRWSPRSTGAAPHA